jgi:hypothetical protein
MGKEVYVYTPSTDIIVEDGEVAIEVFKSIGTITEEIFVINGFVWVNGSRIGPNKRVRLQGEKLDIKPIARSVKEFFRKNSKGYYYSRFAPSRNIRFDMNRKPSRGIASNGDPIPFEEIEFDQVWPSETKNLPAKIKVNEYLYDATLLAIEREAVKTVERVVLENIDNAVNKAIWEIIEDEAIKNGYIEINGLLDSFVEESIQRTISGKMGGKSEREKERRVIFHARKLAKHLIEDRASKIALKEGLTKGRAQTYKNSVELVYEWVYPIAYKKAVKNAKQAGLKAARLALKKYDLIDVGNIDPLVTYLSEKTSKRIANERSWIHSRTKTWEKSGLWTTRLVNQYAKQIAKHFADRSHKLVETRVKHLFKMRLARSIASESIKTQPVKEGNKRRQIRQLRRIEVRK